ncbi:hypothetical protein NMY22_g13096 [Coprinellus aureogranulatus]|nr:hypothetical protein NMY22_g13096 [Coprinellus aureogranulatus]
MQADPEEGRPYKVLSEEVNVFGEIIYEIEWEGWQREDGTNTLWRKRYPPGTDGDKVIKKWVREQNKRRQEVAKQGQDMELSSFLDFHNNDTRYRAQAYDEKKATGILPEHDFSKNYWREKAREASLLRDSSADEQEERDRPRRSKRRKIDETGRHVSGAASSSSSKKGNRTV